MKIPNFDLICEFEDMPDKTLLAKAPLGMCQQRGLAAMMNGVIFKLDFFDMWRWGKPIGIRIVPHVESEDDSAKSGEV
jgi:hypothetical protein